MSKTQRLREQLYLLQGSRCFYCDDAIPAGDRSLEHVIPSCGGGLADSNNAVVVCEAANQLLGSATPKQKMIMLKAGGGKIACPRHCGLASNVTDVYDDMGNLDMQYANHLRSTGKNTNSRNVVSNTGSNRVDDESKLESPLPRTAKQKHKARASHQSMPRPASGPRRR